MEKLDWKKQYKELYFPKTGVISEVKFPKMKALMIDGTGDPNKSTQFGTAIEMLYGISYTLKFMLKKSGRENYSVFPLEGLWWADDMRAFSAEGGDKSQWKWTIFVIQPDFIKKEDVAMAIKLLKERKKESRTDEVRFEVFDEGEAVQIMHIGSFSSEGPNILKLHDYIKEKGWQLSGKHHEVYLSDPRRTSEDKLKTLIRQPYKK